MLSILPRQAAEALLNLPFRLRDRRSITVGTRTKLRYRAVTLKRGCTVRAGDSSLVAARVLFDKREAHLTVGDRTFIGRSAIVIADRVSIGSDVLISWGCTIVDHDSHSLRFSERRDDASNWLQGKKDWSSVETDPVTIEDKAWIGLNAVILKGVTIGEGAIVGAASVVTRDVDPWTIVAGNPARLIRRIPINER